MNNYISNSHCYLWRYRNKDHTFMSWSDVTIRQLCYFGEHYAEVSGTLPKWTPSTLISWNPDEISVTQNHYYYMWSKEQIDDFTITKKFKDRVILNYEDLILACENKLANTKSEKQIEILTKQMGLYAKCVTEANKRFDERIWQLPHFDN